MPIVADAAVAVRGDLSGFKRDLAGAEKQTQTLGAKLKSALTPGNVIAGLGITAGFAGVTQIIAGATNAAAEFQDSVSATGVIFGQDMIPEMEAWGEAASRNFGASKQEAMSAANVIATLGKSAGLAGQDLVNFSQEMVQLGGDLASMFGGTTQDAITAVSAALRGESEPIRRYGVLLDDATLRQQAFEMGIVSTIKNALTPQQRVLAAQAAIIEQTSDAQGDFIRTSDGMANTQRTIAAELANVNIELGEKMMPVMLAFATWMKNDGIPLLTEFIDLLGMDVGSADGIPIVGAVEDFLNDASNLGPRINDHITGNFAEISKAAEELGIDYETMRARVRAALDGVGGDTEKAIAKVIQSEKVLEQAKGWEAYQEQIRSGGSGIDKAAADMADGIPQAMEDAKEAGEAIARVTPGSLANQLRENIDDYDEAIDELADVAANSVSDLAERQKIEGILASQQLTDALNSDSTRTRLLAMELVNDLVSDYELIAPGALAAGTLVNPKLSQGLNSNLGLVEQAARGIKVAVETPLSTIGANAYPWGFNIGDAVAQGMWDSMHLISNAAYAMANTASNQIRIESEPPDHSSPLYGITKWGGNIVKTIADGIYDELGAGSQAAAALSASLVPNFSTPALGLAGASPLATAAVGTGPTYIVNVNGVQRTIRSEEEALQALRDLGAFSDGRIA